ncbi:MAG: MFS transporter [Rhodospirillaceae bacterium]|nr:MFS transporter [Rhodospirillaceae bacterium]
MQPGWTIWHRGVGKPTALTFAIMFTLESMARASLATVIPLQAYALLGRARDVSILNFVVGIAGLTASFSIPLLIRRFRRRWMYTAGALALIAAAALLATATLPGQVSGMLVRAYGVAALNITVQLYVMDNIRKRDFVKSEPLKMMLGAFAWTACPWLGVWLYQNGGPGAAELFSAGAAVAALSFFWVLRMQDNPAVRPATRPAPSPLANIARFLAQPRLRLAWIIPFGRSSWWSMFFVYPPLYMVTHGRGELAGALLVSAGNALLLLTPFAGRLAARVGLRRPVIAAFLLLGSATLAAAAAFNAPGAVAAFLLFGAVGAVTLDALGNIPFMRTVHPYERPEMTTVFRTYIDLSDLLPSGVFAALLSLPGADIRVVFIASGLWMLVSALFATRLPRRM